MRLPLHYAVTMTQGKSLRHGLIKTRFWFWKNL